MARTEKDTVENLINDTGLTNIEAGKVVGELLKESLHQAKEARRRVKVALKANKK